MDEDEGMESFSIDDRDLEYALNPRRHFQSKEQATYGVWADEDSDDEEGRGGGRRGFGGGGGGGRKPNYTAPVNFISGGFKGGSSQEQPSEQKKADEDNDEPIELNYRKFTAPPPKKPKPSGGNVFAGMRVSSNSAAPDPTKFADWTKNSKGGAMAMKMMKAMGYEHGKGLGKEGQGIVEPVQAAVRPGRAAVGAYGKEVTGPKFGESAADAQKRAAEEASSGVGRGEEREEVKPLPKGAWKRNAKVRTTYRTMDDVIKDGGSIGLRAAKQSGEKVIDMTGPEQRVYTGYDALMMKSMKSDGADASRSFDIPELSHNLNLLIDLTEEEIRRTNHSVKTLEDQTTALRYDMKLLQGELLKEEDELTRMKEVYALLESLNSPSVSMDELKLSFCRLRADYSAEYALLELDKVAVAAILPQIKKLLSTWRPLESEQKDFNYDLMQEWKDILAPSERDRHIFSATTAMGALVNDRLAAFDRLMWDAWMPPVRRAILAWDPRDQMEVMIDLVELWLPLMPQWMRDKFIEQLLIPRISTRVDEWDPLTDAVPIHQWLVPWLEIMGDRMAPIFAPIRQKLSKALRLWHATDETALAILQPWQDVWAPATMSMFLAQNVVPKLKAALAAMNLDPSKNAVYPEFKATLKWMHPDGLISVDIISDVLVQAFFPKWFDTLCFWLDSPHCNKNEVKTWLAEWNSRIPPALIDFPAVKEYLRRGMLALMGQRPPPIVPPQPQPTPLLTAPLAPPPPSRPVDARLSLKELLEMMAADQGFTFVPQPGRIKEGKQVYWFGTQSVYLNGGFVYCFNTSTLEWAPIATDQLLSIA